MAEERPDSTTEILDRLLDYLDQDEGIDMIYLNHELENLSDCIDRTGIRKLEVNETGILLHGLMIVDSQLKKLGLVSHLLKNIKDSIYDKSIWNSKDATAINSVERFFIKSKNIDIEQISINEIETPLLGKLWRLFWRV